jgi:hypothetical protein
MRWKKNMTIHTYLFATGVAHVAADQRIAMMLALKGFGKLGL